jgi:hypothetical protein
MSEDAILYYPCSDHNAQHHPGWIQQFLNFSAEAAEKSDMNLIIVMVGGNARNKSECSLRTVLLHSGPSILKDKIQDTFNINCRSALQL